VTTVQQLDAAWGRIDEAQKAAHDPLAQREFALAKTAIEDASMRFNRGMARESGSFRISDFELPSPADSPSDPGP
jgi:hypothetical protein